MHFLWQSLRLLAAALVLVVVIVSSTADARSWGSENLVVLREQGAFIIIPASWWQDAALSLATRDLSSFLSASYRVPCVTVRDTDIEVLPANAFVIGDQQNRWIEALVDTGALELPELVEEGFIIQHQSSPDSPIVVSGQGILGNVYGVFRLLEDLRLDPSALFRPLEVKAEPAMTFRLVSDPTDVNYPSPEQALRWGYNAVCIEPWPGLVLYDGFDPAIFDPKRHSSARSWVVGNRERARRQIEAAKRLHLKVVSPGDVISFPEQVLYLYGAEVADNQQPPRFCIGKEKTRRLLEYGLDEVLRDFPEIDAVMVRVGENYSGNPMMGNTPDQGDCSSPPYDYADRIALVIKTLRAVTDAHQKTYIQRAWDLGDGGFHASPEVAGEVVEGMTPDERLLLSFKHTKSDFWRYNEVNPNIGAGSFHQMVEFQAAREYEGKGAFPNYLGEVYASGAEETAPSGGIDYAYQRGVRAIWVWARGGGWGGPYLEDDLWIDANVYALSHLAWDPKLDPNVVAEDWACLRFGPAAAPTIAKILMKSADVVLKAFYIGPYAQERGGAWLPNNLWVRDDVIYGGDRVAELYRLCRDSEFDIALREKAEAEKLIDSMIADWRRAQPFVRDRALANRALNTLLYEKSLVQTLHYYLAGMFYYYRWQEGSKDNAFDRQLAIDNIRRWEESWGAHNSEIAHLPGVATPFRDWGMGQTVQAALEDLIEKP